MGILTKQREWLFLIVCLGLGLLAETSFLRGQIGVSYLVFISGFYTIVFIRFGLTFNHRRIGLLFMVAIWMLSGSFIFYDNILFYNLNLIIIPILVFSHLVLISRSNTFKWNTPKFMMILTDKLVEGAQYSLNFCNEHLKVIFKNMNEYTARTIKRILVGLVIGVPLLLIITSLLMSADTVFQDYVLQLPDFLLRLNFIEGSLRFIYVVIVGLIFFGVFQVLHVGSKPVDMLKNKKKSILRIDSITAITILIMLNSIYLFFVFIQFRYFFNDVLMDGFTYAAYARKGFFELILVMLINWTMLISFLKLVVSRSKGIKWTLNIMYSLLIMMSGVMLASAYQRLSMYEAAYGFTMDRILAHAFILFLLVIFAYTFIRVWIERISLLHFYLIMGLIFYTTLNVVNLNQIIVDKNIERYEQTGKIDVYYLDTLYYTGWNGLIELYKLDNEFPNLRDILQDRKQWVEQETASSWQSFNFARDKVTKKLIKLNLSTESDSK